MCCTSKSHKSAKDRDIIRFNQDESHIKLQIRKNNVPYRIDMHLKKEQAKGHCHQWGSIRKASELFRHSQCGILLAGGSEYHKERAIRRGGGSLIWNCAS